MAHAGIVVAFCDDRIIKMAVRGAVMGGITFVIFFIVIVGVIASVPLYMHRKAVRDSRRVGAPDARQTATFRGGMWWPGKFQAGPDTMSLDFFDWGIRLDGGFLSPVWEARYEELTEARLVKAPMLQGIRFHAGDGEGEVFFWTWGGSEVLDRLEEHVVAVDRAAVRVPSPPPISTSKPGSPYLTGVPPIGPLRPARPDPAGRPYGALATAPLLVTFRDRLRRGSQLHGDRQASVDQEF
jgi:hypothetical protein